MQDGYQIYHHVFVFTADGRWAWYSRMNQATAGPGVTTGEVTSWKLYSGTPFRRVRGAGGTGLNLVASESAEARDTTLYLAQRPVEVIKDLKRIMELAGRGRLELNLPAAHPVPGAGRIEKTLNRLYDLKPSSYEQVLAVEGVGPATVRAFALVSEVVYNVRTSRRDPVRYSFAHGGKDGHPFPVNRENYNRSIVLLENALRRAKAGQRETVEALKRLASITKI